MNETIGNQPLSALSELGWLAGIIDGEGCLQLAKQKYRNIYHFRPQLSVSNTNPIIIQEIVRIANKNGLPVYVMDRGYATKNSLCTVQTLQIMGLKRMEHWLSVLAPYIVGKRQQVEIIREYIKYRLSLPNPAKGIVRFGQQDLDFRARIDKANHQNETRTAQRLNVRQVSQSLEGIV